MCQPSARWHRAGAATRKAVIAARRCAGRPRQIEGFRDMGIDAVMSLMSKPATSSAAARPLGRPHPATARLGGVRHADVLFLPGSSAMATHIALYEVGVPFEAKLTALHDTNRAPDYLAAPGRRVPTLMIDGDPDRGGDPVVPGAALSRSRASTAIRRHRGRSAGHLLMSFIASTIHPARRAGDDRWREVFVLAEQRLGSDEWAVDRYSIADIHLFRSAGALSTRCSPRPPPTRTCRRITSA